MFIKEELLQQVPHTKGEFEHYLMERKFIVIASVRRNAYQRVSDFDRGRFVGFPDCGLLYYSIVGRDPMTRQNGIYGFRTVVQNAM